MRVLRLTLLTTSALVAALFAFAFALSLVRPVAVESLVREVIRREVEQQVAERIAALDGAVLSKLAARVSERNAGRIAELKRALEEGVPQKVAAVVAEMQNAGCDCRSFVAKATDHVLTLGIVARTGLYDQLTRLIRAKYMEVSAALLREFRIFTAANALVFLLLFVTTLFRRRAGLQLLLPAVVLAGSAAVVASLYVFGQDWLHTILFSDYVGLAYFGYLGVAVVFLADIGFNHARVSTVVVNAAFSVAGAAISATPC